MERDDLGKFWRNVTSEDEPKSLINKDKFLNAQYVRTLCQESTPFFKLEPKLFEMVDAPTGSTEMLTAFEGHLRFYPRKRLQHC